VTVQRARTPVTCRDKPGPVPRDVRADVFDTDGVITDRARVRAAAWQSACDALAREHPPVDPARRYPFDVRDDHLRYVDGRSRLDGAAACRTSRGAEATQETVLAVTDAQGRMRTEQVRAHGVEACPGTVRPVRAPRRAGVHRAAAAESRHAGKPLTGAGVLDLFDLLVDGAETARPRPAGRAGRRCGFGLVTGVDRSVQGNTGARPLRHVADGAGVGVPDPAEPLREGASR
jgi:beta-phosphoglucomutase-like phosphatase (HAD superfamily)